MGHGIKKETAFGGPIDFMFLATLPGHWMCYWNSLAVTYVTRPDGQVEVNFLYTH